MADHLKPTSGGVKNQMSSNDRPPNRQPPDRQPPFREPGPFPYHPVALKILGDGVLAITLLRADRLPAETAATAIVLALFVGMIASATAGAMLVRLGQRELWDVTSVACLAAMAVLLFFYGAVVVALILGAFAWWRWRRVRAEAAR